MYAILYGQAVRSLSGSFCRRREMAGLNINVYADIGEKRLLQALKDAELPQNIKVSISDHICGKADLVITDNAGRAEELAGKAGKTLQIVFVGHASPAPGIYDVWDTDDPVEIKVRFERILRAVAAGYGARFAGHLSVDLSELADTLPFPMMILTPDMKAVSMNEEFMNIVGVTPEQIPDFSFEEWKAQALVPVGEAEKNDEKHFISREYKMHAGGGYGERTYVIRIREIRDECDNVCGSFLMMDDVTYRRAYEESAFRAANTDMLTGMYNRRFFYNYLSENSEKPMTLFYMDLDRFKYVNEHYGHAKGDEVIVSTSRVIKTHFPKAVSARLGGDEFALVIDGVLSEEEIRVYTTNLENTIQRIFTADGLPVTMSTGVVTYEGGGNIDELMHEGDRKMYEAKKRHRDSEDYE